MSVTGIQAIPVILYMEPILLIIVFIFSIILHELAHGYAADALGDPTARLAGRLTLNPIKHIDPVGSILVPLITSLANFTFGWAKPVPYNPYNLKNKRQGEFLIAAAGPATNLLLAVIFGLFLRFSAGSSYFSPAFAEIIYYIVAINVVLAIFNLIPIPPLDGSKLWFSLLPQQYGRFRQTLEAYAPIWILIVVIFVWELIAPVVPYIVRLIIGI